MLSIAIEQRIVVKFLMKLGRTPHETYSLLKAVYGSQCLSRARVFVWFKRFQDGREDVKDDLHRVSTSTDDKNIKKVGSMVLFDKRLSIREIAENVGIGMIHVRRILNNTFNMQKVCDKMVPKVLTFEQHEARDIFCTDALNAIKKDPNFLAKIITCDDSWFYLYKFDTKCQSVNGKDATSSKINNARTNKPKIRERLIVFFDMHGIILHDWVPKSKIFDEHYYMNLLGQLHERIRKKRPNLWENKTWILHQSNGPAYSAYSVRKFLANFGIPMISHPHCSPDLAPHDFFLFHKLKISLQGKKFSCADDIRRKVTSALMKLKKKDFQQCFQQWKVRMERCAKIGGGYIEGGQILAENDGTASDSDEGTNMNVKETVGSSRRTATYSCPSATVSQGNGQSTSTNQELNSEFSEEMFNNSINTDSEAIDNPQTGTAEFKILYDSAIDTESKKSIKKRMQMLNEELADLKVRRQQEERKFGNIQDVVLRQRVEDIIYSLLTKQIQKEKEYEKLQQLLEQE